MDKNCVGYGDCYGCYKCWNGLEWEWRIQNEDDLTADLSRMTSMETDNLLQTSPSAAAYVLQQENDNTAEELEGEIIKVDPSNDSDGAA